MVHKSSAAESVSAEILCIGEFLDDIILHGEGAFLHGADIPNERLPFPPIAGETVERVEDIGGVGAAVCIDGGNPWVIR